MGKAGLSADGAQLSSAHTATGYSPRCRYVEAETNKSIQLLLSLAVTGSFAANELDREAD